MNVPEDDAKPVHEPVLVDSVVRLLSPAVEDELLDLTVGGGGHASALLKHLGPRGRLVGVDRDPQALAVAAKVLDDPRVQLLRGDFGELGRLRGALSKPAVFDGVVIDLGLSSLQLDDPRRGFSFRNDGPLDMRMDPDQRRVARDFVNGESVENLTRMFATYGEERYAARIAEAVARARGRGPIETTVELARIVRRAIGGAAPKTIDAATRTFQALRIATNEELDKLDRFLSHFEPWLKQGGRLAILAYHSLEDRRVKTTFRQLGQRGDYDLLTPRALRPSHAELQLNPRARSARLRGLRKRGKDGRR